MKRFGNFAGSGLRRAAVVSAAVIVLGLAAAACGDDEDDGSDAGATGATGATGAAEAQASGAADPCSLLTTAEVGDAGVKASDPQAVDSPTGGEACNYGDDPIEGVTVIVQPGGGQSYFDQSEELLSASSPVSGLGDQAVLDDSNPQQVTVLVLEGDTVLSVGGSISASDAESLAEKALSRLAG